MGLSVSTCLPVLCFIFLIEMFFTLFSFLCLFLLSPVQFLFFSFDFLLLSTISFQLLVVGLISFFVC